MSGADDLVDLVLLQRGDRPVAIEQTVRRLTSLSAKAAHKLVESEPLPQVLIAQLPRGQGEALKLELEAVGAVLELRPSGPPGAPTDLR